MGRTRLQGFDDNGGGLFSDSGIGLPWSPQTDEDYQPGGLFASVGKEGMGFGISPTGLKLPDPSLFTKYMLSESGFPIDGIPELVADEARVVEEEGLLMMRKKKKGGGGGFRLKMKIGNPSLRRLISGAIAGAVSRSSVAPLETIKTHVMVGSCGCSSTQVFQNIMKSEGWKGLYRGNLVNVIRVAPSKGIEYFAYDTIKKQLTPKPGEQPKLPIPASPLAGAIAGICSTLFTYPLELLKTRITVQRGVYKNLVDAFLKIAGEEGPAELYRGLAPSIIGVVPYAAANYFAYDTLRKAYKKLHNREEIGNVATLLMGSASAGVSSGVTFPLEVARRHMQAGAINGRQYKNIVHALVRIVEQEGLTGLYRGLGASWMKLVPAAGISFMCYEACKRILVEKEDDR